MRIIAGMLSISILRCLGFYSASVDINNSTITAQTNYTFTLALTASLITIPANFEIVIELPSTLKLQTTANSMPKYCTILGFTEYSITKPYNSASPYSSQGECGISGPNTVTLITPYAIPVQITFKIGLITNPSIAYNGKNIGNVLLYGYYANTSSYSYSYNYTFDDSTYKPGNLNLIRFDQSNLDVGGWSSYTVAFSNNQAIPMNGLVILSFTSDSSLQSTANTIMQGSVNNTSNLNLNVAISGTQVTATGLFKSNVYPGSLISVVISQVKNPKFVGYSYPYIYTATSSNEYIEKTNFTIAAINPCYITLNYFIPLSNLVLTNTQIALYFSNDIYSASNTNNQFYFKILFPSTYVVQNTSNCLNTGGLSTSPSLSCTISNNQFTSNLVNQIDQTVSIRLTNIINPPNNLTTGYIQIYLYTSSNVLICMNSQFFSFSATPGMINMNAQTRSSQYLEDPGPYMISFTTSTIIPSGGYIKVVIPLDQFVETTGISCLTPNSTVNICSKSSSPINPNTVELNMKEWCSISDTNCNYCCSAGTQLQFYVYGIKNPEYYVPVIASNLQVYTYNPAMTGVIDMNTAAGQFVPSLVYKNLIGAVSRTINTVQLSTAYSFQYLSSTQYISGSNLILYLMPGAIFPLSSSISCYNSSISFPCSYTLNTDGSVNTIAIPACPNGCLNNTFFSITISNIKNPNTVSPIQGNFAITSYYNAYTIESILFNNNLPPLQTNSINNVIMTRSSDVVSTSITLNLTFSISSYIPPGGLISIILPQDVLVLDTSLSVYSGTGSLLYTGSLTLLNISNYCSSGCSSMSFVSIGFKGIKNIDSVRNIAGNITIRTSYAYDIDTCTIDIATVLTPILPGQMYNVDLHPVNPTVSVTTNYRIIFTTQNSIPAGSSIEIGFPVGPLIAQAPNCASYLTIEPTLLCSLTGNKLYITNGFSSDYTGSYMIGIVINNITNPGSPLIYSPVTIETKDKAGYTIDSYLSGQLDYYLQSTNCTCNQCSGNICWDCIVPSNEPFLLGYSCVDSCSSDYFLVYDGTYDCIQCHFTCSSCSSQLASDCLTCANGYYKSNGYCVSACPAGTVLINNQCSNLNSCVSPCSMCTSNTSYCLMCSTGYLVPNTGVCTSVCPTGYYLNGTQCSQCFEKCASCVVKSDYCTSCHEYYLDQYLYGTSCVSACPPNITVLNNGVCVSCDNTCNTCTQLGPNACSSCTGNRYLYQTACLITCPSGYYKFQNNTCISTCSPGYYITSDLSSCLSCDSSCSTCASQSNCTSCSGSLYLYNNQCLALCPNGYLRFAGNLCIESNQCSQGYYRTLTDCFNCSSECYSCSNNASCSSCTGSYYFYNNSCLLQCPTGYLKYSDNTCGVPSLCGAGMYIKGDQCLPCDSTCSTCNGGSGANCTSCAGSGYLYSNQCLPSCPPEYYKFQNNTCASNCNPGYYITSDLSSCLPCNETCEVCNGPSAYNCTGCTGTLPYLLPNSECASSCELSQYLYNSICYEVCPNTTYYINLTKNYCTTLCPTNFYVSQSRCYECDPGCKTCKGPGSCTSCIQGYYSTLDNKCVQSCPPGYLVRNNTCVVKCNDTACLTCQYSTPGICQLCDNAHSLIGSTCVSSCPASFYSFNGNCCACGTGCQQCTDSSVCNKCLPGYNLFGSACLAQCPGGYFAYLGACSSCNSSCSTCSDSASCSSCKSGSYYFNAACYSACPSGTAPINGVCEYTCPENCGSCSQGLCTSCSTGSLYLGDCYGTCPGGFYSEKQKCLECGQSCNACTGLSGCTNCTDSYLYQGQCYDSCPSGTKTVGGGCVLTCDPNCESCTPEKCEKCTTPYNLYQGKCVTCPEGTYAYNSSCLSCSPGCSSCHNETVCTDCSIGYLYNNDCVSKCPEGFTIKQSECIKEVSVYQSYTVYFLIAEAIATGLVAGLGLVIRSDSYLLVPTTTGLISITEVSAKIALLVSLWEDYSPASNLLVPVLSSLLIGTTSISAIFVYMHLDPLTSSNASLRYYSSQHSKFYWFMQLTGIVCGVQFFRIIYSGLFGLSATTEGKSLGISMSFRYPLEKLCYLNAVIVSIPLIISTIVIMSVYPIVTNAWQVSLFTFVLNAIVYGHFLYNYYKSAWRL